MQVIYKTSQRSQKSYGINHQTEYNYKNRLILVPSASVWTNLGAQSRWFWPGFRVFSEPLRSGLWPVTILAIPARTCNAKSYLICVCVQYRVRSCNRRTRDTTILKPQCPCSTTLKNILTCHQYIKYSVNGVDVANAKYTQFRT